MESPHVVVVDQIGPNARSAAATVDAGAVPPRAGAPDGHGVRLLRERSAERRWRALDAIARPEARLPASTRGTLAGVAARWRGRGGGATSPRPRSAP